MRQYGASPRLIRVSSDKHVELVINGEPLLAPTGGLGVYTARLIRGLLRHTDLNFRVLLDASLRGGVADIPEGICTFLRSSRLPHPVLRQLARSHRVVDCAKTQYPNAIFHAPAPFWSSQRPQRTIVTLHDCIYRHFPKYLGRFPLRRRLAFATERYAASSRLVLTVSNYSAKELCECGGIPAQKIRVLYNWVSPEFERESISAEQVEAIRTRFQLPQRFWLYVGGYDYRKNVELLISAYSAATRELDCPPLVLAGAVPSQTSPPYSDVLGAVRRNRVESQVILTGSISAADLPPLYRGAELFIYPSLYEGFGLPVIEAIAAGTPVIASGTSSLGEIIEKPECRFDPLSVQAITAKLVQAADHPATFRCTLRPEFVETYAIARYVELIRSI